MGGDVLQNAWVLSYQRHAMEEATEPQQNVLLPAHEMALCRRHSQDHLITLTCCYTGKRMIFLKHLGSGCYFSLDLFAFTEIFHIEHTRSLSLLPLQRSLLAKLKFPNTLLMFTSRRNSCACPGTRRERSSTCRNTS